MVTDRRPLWRRLLTARTPRTVEFGQAWDAWRRLPFEVRLDIMADARARIPYRDRALRDIAVGMARAMRSRSWLQCCLINAVPQVLPSVLGFAIVAPVIHRWILLPFVVGSTAMVVMLQSARIGYHRRRALTILRANDNVAADGTPASARPPLSVL